MVSSTKVPCKGTKSDRKYGNESKFITLKVLLLCFIVASFTYFVTDSNSKATITPQFVPRGAVLHLLPPPPPDPKDTT